MPVHPCRRRYLYILLTVDDGAANYVASVQVIASMEYTITADAGTGGTVRSGEFGTELSIITEKVRSGQDSSLIYVTPETGYNFARWNDGSTSRADF